MYFILAILLFIAIKLILGLINTGAKAGYNKMTEPSDTLKKVERDAERVANYFHMNSEEALNYKNMQRFGICFARFALMVSIADGVLDPNELASIISFFKGADPEYIKAISENLKKDIRNPKNIDWQHNTDVAKELFTSPFLQDYDTVLFDGLLRVAAADGNIDTKEVQIITGIMAILGWSHDRILLHLENRFQPYKEENENEKLDWAYRTLGLCKGCSKDEIKKVYRNLAKQYHPDMVRHLGENLQKTATERFHEIKSAYEYLLQVA